MTNKYDAVMKSKQDEDLVKIAFLESGKYDKDAVISADRELKSRNLSEEYINELLNDGKHREETNKNKSVEPLGVGVKIWVFIFPAVLNFVFAYIYKADGYDRKVKEVWKWTLYGWCFYLGLIIFALLLFIMFSY